MPLTKITGGEFDNTQGGLIVAGIITASSNLLVSGNLGIGTLTPQEKFHISNSASSNYIRLDNPSGRAYYGLNSSGDTEIIAATNNNLIFKTFGTERARLDTSGRLGIGTNNPTSPLHVVGDVLLSSINSGPLAGARNCIINGNFDIWQRGTTSTVTTAGSNYLTDRYIWNTSGNTTTVSRQAFTVGQTDVPYEPTYFHRIQITAAISAQLSLEQRIEDVRTLAGRTATLSFYAKGAAGFTLNYSVAQNFGTGGSPSSGVSVGSGTVSLTTSWQKFTITFNVPSISGKTLGTNNDHFLQVVWQMPASATNTFDLAQVQLEAGTVATPFERRSYGQELALCQRYYEKSFNVEVAPANGGTATSFVTEEGFSAAVSTNRLGSGTVVRFAVTKRASPTITKIGNSSGQWRWIAPAGTAHTYSANLEPANVGASGFVMQQQVSDGSLVFLQGHWTASIEL
jgi:hypothetical protein